MHSFIRCYALITMGLCLVGLSACGGSPQQEAGARESEASAETVSDHMDEHFSEANAIVEAVIRGDLKGAREAAQWMAEHQPVAGLPEGWEPHVTAMQNGARVVVEAGNIDTAAAGVAEMAKACGDCHSALAAQPPLEPSSPPPEDSGTVSHMLGHMWAADRMLEGLTTPSDEAWMSGVGVLAGAPLHAEDLSEQSEMKADLEALANQVHDFAAQGRDIEGLDARAELYGQFLATCAKCHQMVGSGGVQ